jgi:dTDP-glucose 4,6-dehydratase/UDP-glucose 4-epimerase
VSKTFLVTGGAGFLGSALVKKLLGQGHAVRVLDDMSRGRPRRLADVEAKIELVHGDVRDFGAVDKATRGVDAVCHLAFVNGTEFFYSKPKLVLEVGVKGAIHTLDAAAKHGVREYFVLSSSEVYQSPPKIPTDESAPLIVPDPMNPRYSYGGGKIITELLSIHYAKEHFDRMVIVRPHNVYGPDMGWEHVIPQFALRAAEAIESQPSGAVRFKILGDGAQTRAFCHIDDFTDGCWLAFSKGEARGIYHVGTQEELSIKQLAAAVFQVLGRDATIEPSEPPKGETSRRCPDVTKVSRLGYAPKVPLARGLEETVRWYVANRALKNA